MIVATETFPADSIDYWIDSWEDNWVLGNFIWTAIDYIGESSIGANGHNTPDTLAYPGHAGMRRLLRAPVPLPHLLLR